MLIFYLRNLTGVQRSVKADIHLGLSLAFIAGAMNAGGFLAVQQYTSHMTGIVSSMADGLAIGNLKLVLASIGSMVCFIVGAGFTELMVNWQGASTCKANMPCRWYSKRYFWSVSGCSAASCITIWGFSSRLQSCCSVS